VGAEVRVVRAHVALLQPEAALNAEEPEVHVQDLPERELRPRWRQGRGRWRLLYQRHGLGILAWDESAADRELPNYGAVFARDAVMVGVAALLIEDQSIPFDRR
jgi:hypothetical protein